MQAQANAKVAKTYFGPERADKPLENHIGDVTACMALYIRRQVHVKADYHRIWHYLRTGEMNVVQEGKCHRLT